MEECLSAEVAERRERQSMSSAVTSWVSLLTRMDFSVQVVTRDDAIWQNPDGFGRETTVIATDFVATFACNTT
jgi:hypothetical protein